MQRLLKILRRLQAYADRPWYLPTVALLGGLDLFILIIPTDALLISSVLLRPRSWIRATLWATSGCALGSLALGALVQWEVADWLRTQLPETFGHSYWIWTEQFIGNHGAIALAVIAFSPFPQLPGVVIAALGGMSLPTLFLAVWVGRFVKYGIYAYIASHAPKFLMKIPLVRQELDFLYGAPPKKR